MPETEAPNDGRSLNGARMAAAAMALGGGVLALAALAWAVFHLVDLSQSGHATPSEVVSTAALLLLGCGFGLLLWGGAWMLRRLDDLVEAARAAASAPANSSAAKAGDEAQTRLLAELVGLTREVRDIALLGEKGRAARLQSESQALVHQLTQEVTALLREHDWIEAGRRVQRARERFPSLPDWAAFDAQIEQTRAAAESRDLETATREVTELVTLGAWDRAAEIVRHFQDRHPTSHGANELARRVAAGREKATAEVRAHLMAQAQDATNRRDWTEALHLVESLLEKYPNSPEAHDLRPQLETLRTNVQIQARHQMESEIRDLIKDQHFADALRVARELIARYPDSPQAAILRDQLPRLEQLSIR